MLYIIKKNYICPEGYTKKGMDICINMNKTANKEHDLICDYPYFHIIDDTCMIYKAIDRKNE